MNESTSQAVTQMKQNGWVLIKNFFSKQEIQNFRQIGEEIKVSHFKGDLLSHPKARYILTDDRIINLVKSVLETDDVVYFGDSNCSVGSATLPGFHKDSPDKFNPDGPDWKSEYSIVRLGVYLQDHAHHSAALSIRNKSHHYPNHSKGKALYVDSEPGDLVMWYLTTSHSGNSKRFKWAPNVFIPFRLYRLIPHALFEPEEKERFAYFLTFGKKDHHLERYLRYLKNRRYMVEIWQESNYDAGAEDLMRQKGIVFMNVNKEVKDWDLNTISEKHVEMEA